MRIIETVRVVTVCMILAGLAVSEVGEIKQDVSKVRIYYDTFGATKYLSVTRETIRMQYDISSLVKGEESRILKLLRTEGVPGKFSEINVCFLFESESEKIYVDWKYVVSDGNRVYRLPLSARMELYGLLLAKFPRISEPIDDSRLLEKDGPSTD